MNTAYQVVRMFEEEVAKYAGCRHAVAVDSCTNAIFLSLYYLWHYDREPATGHTFPENGILGPYDVWIPARTYVSVPMAALHAGGRVHFDNRSWRGAYKLEPYPVWDGAKRFRRNMFPETCGEIGFLCLSFHANKILSIGKGGMILTNDGEAAERLREMRYEGRHQKPYNQDTIEILGWNMYMTPEQAARGLTLMCSHKIGDDNPDQIEEGGYRDLREFPVFKNHPLVTWLGKTPIGEQAPPGSMPKV